MKKIIIALLLVSSGLFIACDTAPETANVSKVTNYPNLELIGAESVIISQGDVFTDPGIIATEGGNTIPYTTSVSGRFRGGTTLDTTRPDIYVITYSAVNQDGFTGAITRTVIVADTGDLTTDISGLYRSTVTRNGVLTAQYTDLEYVLIWKNTDGTYELSDGIGGYYDFGRSYGVGYAAPGAVITANDIPSNSFSYSTFEVSGFGGGCTMNSMTVNATARTINFTTVWSAGFTFSVLLEQVQL